MAKQQAEKIKTWKENKKAAGKVQITLHLDRSTVDDIKNLNDALGHPNMGETVDYVFRTSRDITSMAVLVPAQHPHEPPLVPA